MFSIGHSRSGVRENLIEKFSRHGRYNLGALILIFKEVRFMALKTNQNIDVAFLKNSTQSVVRNESTCGSHFATAASSRDAVEKRID